MAAKQEFFTVEDNQLVIHPHLYQQRALDSLAQEVIILKGWQAGFTSIVPWWLINEMRRCGPGNPSLVYLALAPTLNSRMLTDIERVFENYFRIVEVRRQPHIKMVVTPRGEERLWGHAQPERTEILFFQASDPTSFAQLTVLAAVADEITMPLFKRESWEVLQARLKVARSRIASDGRPMGRILAGSTVYRRGHIEDKFNEYVADVRRALKGSPRNHPVMRQEFWERYRSGQIHPVYHFIRFDSTRNPGWCPPPEPVNGVAVPNLEYIKKRAEAMKEVLNTGMQKWFFNMRYRARFVKAAGVIFDGWNPKKHVMKPTRDFGPHNLPKSWPRSVVIDPGDKNFYAHFYAHDEARQRHFLYRVYHDDHKTGPERALDILALEPRLSLAVCGQISEDRARIHLGTGGLFTVPAAFKEFWPGIDLVNAAIHHDMIYFFEGVSKEAEEQMLNYSRPCDEFGEVILGKLPENKETYHHIDILRYYGTHRFTHAKSAPIMASDGPKEQKPDLDRLPQTMVDSGPEADPMPFTDRELAQFAPGFSMGFNW